MNIDFFKELIRLIKTQQDCRVIARTETHEEINITISNGDIVDICCGDLRGVKAVTSSRHQKIVDYQIKDSEVVNLPAKKIPLSTKSILNILSSTLPKDITYDPESILTQAEDSVLKSNSQPVITRNRVKAIQPSGRLSDTSTIALVQECLTKVFGPISDVIFQEVDVDKLVISTNQDLANLINLLLIEIQDEEEKYQNQFLILLLQDISHLIEIDSV